MQIRRVPALVVLAAVLTVGTVSAESVDPDRVARAIRGARAESDAAVRIENVRLDARLATVILERGVLTPATPVAGRPVELAFTGRGRIELDPPNRIEADQLELFTGSRRLSESFQRAVFVIARDSAVDELLGGPRAGAEAGEAAAKLMQDWLGGAERRQLDIGARIYADATGDRLSRDFFCALLEGDRLGRFLYVADPLAAEQVTIGRFVRPDLDRRQQRAIRLALDRARNRGKLIGLEIADLGTWDTWVSASLVGESGAPTPGARGVEPDHYELAIRLAGPGLALEGRARMTLRAVADGLCAVAVRLHPDLLAVRVTEGRGRELPWFRSRNELVVALPAAVAAGDAVELVIDYRGRLVDVSDTGATVLRTTTGWHPRAGTIDRATYSVTARWPESYELVAPGAVEALDAAAPGERSLRWRIDRPVIGTSFEIGRFRTLTGRAGEVRIDVAVDLLGQQKDPELGTTILDTVIDVVEYYETLFGPFPLDRLQVVSSPRGFSQGLLGFVSLSTAAVVDWDIWGALLGLEDRDAVIAHEVAHQWWGNMVGWRSYRDQWISEAMANFAALSWRRDRGGGAAFGPGRPGPTADWQADLLRITETGRIVEGLGPVVLGPRLDSSVGGRAYAAIVYKKGALVLNTLARLLGEATMRTAMRRLVAAADGRVLSTDEFFALLAGLTGRDLSGFERRYIRATGMPDADYTASFLATPDGGWVVEGSLRRRPAGRQRHRIVTAPSGTLDLRTRIEPDPDVEPAVLAVPVEVGLAVEPDRGGPDPQVVRGTVVIDGADSGFRIPTDRRPEVVWLDPGAEVFGRFVSGDLWPRLAALRRAADLETGGDPTAARAAYREALDAPVAAIPEGWRSAVGVADPSAGGAALDARIRLALARLALDAGDAAAAGVELGLARDLIRGRDRWLLDHELLVVESRLALLADDARNAYRELKRRVLGDRPVSSPEIWTLLAVAARRVGDEEVFARARDRAGKLGVDLGPLAGDGVQ